MLCHDILVDVLIVNVEDCLDLVQDLLDAFTEIPDDVIAEEMLSILAKLGSLEVILILMKQSLPLPLNGILGNGLSSVSQMMTSLETLLSAWLSSSTLPSIIPGLLMVIQNLHLFQILQTL
jgi:hypothetical protein